MCLLVLVRYSLIGIICEVELGRSVWLVANELFQKDAQFMSDCDHALKRNEK